MFAQSAFRPNLAYTPNVVAPGVAASAAIALARTPPINAFNAFRIVNRGTDPVGLNFGATAALTVDPTITGAQVVLLPNSIEVIDLPPEIVFFKHIGVAGGNSVSIVEGNGL